MMDSPPGAVLVQALAAQLDELRAVVAELEAELPQVNEPVLRAQVQVFASAAARIVAAHQSGSAAASELADDLAGLASAARGLRLPAQDAELGRTPTLQVLRKHKGLIVAALTDAQDAARALGLTAREMELARESVAEIPRAPNQALLKGIARRLDEVVDRLDALDREADAPTDFAQQRGLLAFYVGAMRVEVDLARLHLALDGRSVDLMALLRAAGAMSDLTRDFMATVRAWIQRVAAPVTQLAEEVRGRVRRVVGGVRTMARWIARGGTRAGSRRDSIDDKGVPAATTVQANPRAESPPPPPPTAPETRSARTGFGLSSALEVTLHRALRLAHERRHAYATLEHLLLALTDDGDAAEVLLACGADLVKLRSGLLDFVDKDLTGLVEEGTQPLDPKPTAGFQRVVQRAAIHVQAAGGGVVSGANVLVALFSERESHAAYFLEMQNVTRVDAVAFIRDGRKKFMTVGEAIRTPQRDVLLVGGNQDQGRDAIYMEIHELGFLCQEANFSQAIENIQDHYLNFHEKCVLVFPPSEHNTQEEVNFAAFSASVLKHSFVHSKTALVVFSNRNYSRMVSETAGILLRFGAKTFRIDSEFSQLKSNDTFEEMIQFLSSDDSD